RVDPDAARRRAERARRDRGVEVFPAEDGMAVLRAVLSAADALRCHQALTDTAHADADRDTAAGIDDVRTLDARRADLLVDCLLHPDTYQDQPAATNETSGTAAEAGQAATATTGPTAGTGEPVTRRGRPSWHTTPTQVHVTVPWTVLAGLSDEPAELTGYGPIGADTARTLAAEDAVWRRILTDPATGTALDVGTTSYHPPAPLDEFIRIRDRTCRFPGCRRSARRADLDHTIPHPHGPTSKTNLAALCRPHHRLKTHTRWRVEQHDDGHLEWTSPTGLTHTTDPPEVDPPDELDSEAEN
ncbi:MAG: HNH endonuclease, partial [Geodermatophilaceae bacterium]|nr:HNH endonuclease [Geodermatophilaceae bacterium]